MQKPSPQPLWTGFSAVDATVNNAEAHHYPLSVAFGDTFRKWAQYKAWVVREGLSAWRGRSNPLSWAMLERLGIKVP